MQQLILGIAYAISWMMEPHWNNPVCLTLSQVAKANRKDENGKGKWIQMGMFHPKNSLVVIINWLLIVLN